MSTYIDIKVLNLLSSRLPKFKRKSEYLFNFRCPHCGDSQKSSTKARGFVYLKKNDMFFKCHNCAMGTTVAKLIEFVDANLYKEYVMERYKEDLYYYFREDLLDYKSNKRLLSLILIGSIPLIIVGYALYTTGIIYSLRSIKVIAWTTLVFGVVLYIADKNRFDKKISSESAISTLNNFDSFTTALNITSAYTIDSIVSS